MLKKYYPYAYVSSVFKIDYRKLYDMGIRGLIFDIDNTLVHHGDDSNERVDKLFKYLHKLGFKTIMLSDNDEDRVKRFLKNIDSQYICDANKPDTKGYLKALEKLGLGKEEVVCIGDQIFKDILGANNCGIASILVKFITVEGEKKIGIRRYIEKIILFFYRMSVKYRNRPIKVESGKI